MTDSYCPKVYLVCQYDYEGSVDLCAFPDRELAEKCVAKLSQERKGYDYGVEEMTVRTSVAQKYTVWRGYAAYGNKARINPTVDRREEWDFDNDNFEGPPLSPPQVRHVGSNILVRGSDEKEVREATKNAYADALARLEENT